MINWWQWTCWGRRPHFPVEGQWTGTGTKILSLCCPRWQVWSVCQSLEPVQQPYGFMSRQFQWQLGRRGEYPQDHNTWRTIRPTVIIIIIIIIIGPPSSCFTRSSIPQHFLTGRLSVDQGGCSTSNWVESRLRQIALGCVRRLSAIVARLPAACLPCQSPQAALVTHTLSNTGTSWVVHISLLVMRRLRHSHAIATATSSANRYLHVHLHLGWLGSRVVSVLDSGAEGPGFKSQPRRCRVTFLG